MKPICFFSDHPSQRTISTIISKISEAANQVESAIEVKADHLVKIFFVDPSTGYRDSETGQLNNFDQCYENFIGQLSQHISYCSEWPGTIKVALIAGNRIINGSRIMQTR